jgi:hypothetical protein
MSSFGRGPFGAGPFGGGTPEAVTWDKPDERYFLHGLDRGVLYPSFSDPVPWNGLTGVDESGNGSTSISYIDGVIFMADADATDFSGKLSALFFPDEFAECIGMPEVTDGLILDNQKPKRFGLCYRTLIGSGIDGDMFGYQLHLLYNVMATVSTFSRKTINATPAPMEMNFDLVATPVRLAGYRPTAHYIVDTRRLDPETISMIEEILYGDGSTTAGRMPTPTELFEMLSFGPAIQVTHYTADGEINFQGSRTNVYLTSDPTIYQIDNVNAVDNGDGTYTISDGGDTTVTVV